MCMSRLSSTTKSIASHPRLVIEIILALTLLVFGVNLAGPWWWATQVSPITALGYSLTGIIPRGVIGSLYALPAILTLFGIKRSRIRQLGTFGMFIAFMFSSLLRLLTFGWFPLLWLYPLALALIAGVVYLQEFRRDEHGGPNG